MKISSGGEVIRDFDIELSNTPDLWAFVDLNLLAGKKISVRVNTLHKSFALMNILAISETIQSADQLYQEPTRPQFHFSTKRGWINDSNGLVYLNGNHHLFYLHNHYHGDWAFSGGALCNENNTIGFKNGKENVLVAFYTSTGRGECVVYSNDRGRIWTEFEENP
jgi:fructan beta-fructosidase